MKSFITLMALSLSVSAPLAAQTPVQLTPEERALMEAAYTGQLEEVRRLVLDGTPVDAIDEEKRTNTSWTRAPRSTPRTAAAGPP
jgi:hypothetical protein